MGNPIAIQTRFKVTFNGAIPKWIKDGGNIYNNLLAASGGMAHASEWKIELEDGPAIFYEPVHGYIYVEATFDGDLTYRTLETGDHDAHGAAKSLASTVASDLQRATDRITCDKSTIEVCE